MTWGIINRERGPAPRSSEGIKLKIEGKIETNPKRIANEFNKFYVEAPGKIIGQNTNCTRNVPQMPKNRNPHSMFLDKVSSAEIVSMAKQLKNKKSSGLDGVSNWLLKKIVTEICEPLAHLANVSFDSGAFPKIFKIGVIKPLYKKDSIYDIGNYRPVTLLSSISKILEKLFEKRLSCFLRKFKIIAKEQHGF